MQSNARTIRLEIIVRLFSVLFLRWGIIGHWSLFTLFDDFCFLIAELFGDVGIDVEVGELVETVFVEIVDNEVAVGDRVGVGGAGVVDVAVGLTFIDQIVFGGLHAEGLRAHGHEASDSDDSKWLEHPSTNKIK